MTALAGRERGQLESDVLPQFLPRQRWFGAKDARIDEVALTPLGGVEAGRAFPRRRWTSTLGDDQQRYFLPMSAAGATRTCGRARRSCSYTLAKIAPRPDGSAR